MSFLFSPLTLRKLTLANRIAIAPMCQYASRNGLASDWHLMHLGNLSHSGAGMLFIEATAVEPAGRISPNDLGLWSDATEKALTRVVHAVRNHSAMPLAIQLAHAGRKASTNPPWLGGKPVAEADGGWQTVAPSALAFQEGDPPPLALGRDGLHRMRTCFADAAQRADRAGFDVIELHAAHGYLLHQFLSPLSNQRDDEYGGALANRMRFPLEVFDAIRACVPNKPVGIRISASDWVAGGWDLAQSIAFAQALQKRGCDFIDVSSGGLSSAQQIPLFPGYQVDFARQIRAATGMPTIAVGLITEAGHAERIVADGDADMVGLARGMLYNPRWPWHAAAQLGAQVKAPMQFWRAPPHEVKNLFDTQGV